MKKNEVNNESAKKARIKCEMVAALEACRLLHKQGELNDELKPVFRYAYMHVTLSGLSIRAGSRRKQPAIGQTLAGYFHFTLLLILVRNLK